MFVVIRTMVGGLHSYFLPSAATMLLAGNINTVPDVRDGLESLNIVSTAPRAVEFDNAGNQLPDDTVNPCYWSRPLFCCGYL